jgi:hypothetical protein
VTNRKRRFITHDEDFENGSCLGLTRKDDCLNGAIEGPGMTLDPGSRCTVAGIERACRQFCRRPKGLKAACRGSLPTLLTSMTSAHGRASPSIGVGGGHDTAGAQMDQYVAGFDPKYRWPSAPTGRR